MTQAQGKTRGLIMESSGGGNQIERLPSERVNNNNNNVAKSSAGKNKNGNKKKKSDGAKKKKKKRSTLAFWFCMSTKTDTLDRNAQPFPAPKSKSKGKNETKDKQKADNAKDKDKVSNAKPRDKIPKQNKEAGRRNRHSAPPAEWLSMMAALQEAEGAAVGTSGGVAKGDNQGSNNGNDMNRSRSRSPSCSGVRYRFDGTLEKPYVYPGGLTFKGDNEKKQKKKVKKGSKRGSRKGGDVVEADVHYSQDEFDDDDDETDDDDYDDDALDDSDIRKRFYLRYDSHAQKKKRDGRREKRYSVPDDLHLRHHHDLHDHAHHHDPRDHAHHHKRTESDSLGAKYGRGGSRWMEQSENESEDLENRRRMVDEQKRKDEEREEEEYDEPYESDDNDDNNDDDKDTKNGERVKVRLSARRSRPLSYYSPPEHSDDLVYMWHSCEDLRHCDVMYHSEDELQRSREELPPPPTTSISISPHTNPDCAAISGKTGDKDDLKNSLGSNSSPNSNSSKRRNGGDYNVTPNNHHLHKHNGVATAAAYPKSNSPSIKNGDHNSSHQSTSQQNTWPHPHNCSNNNHHNNNNNPHHNINETHHHHQPTGNQHEGANNYHNFHPPTQEDYASPSVYPLSHSLELKRPSKNDQSSIYVKSTKPSKPFDNPFRRNAVRSSCMPGNKRFFLPPPPNYTPPREELAIAQVEIAAQEKKGRRGRKGSCTRGSQTNLTEDVVVVGGCFQDMVERDKKTFDENIDQEVFSSSSSSSTNIQAKSDDCKDSSILSSSSVRGIVSNNNNKNNDNKNIDCNNSTQSGRGNQSSHNRSSAKEENSIKLSHRPVEKYGDDGDDKAERKDISDNTPNSSSNSLNDSDEVVYQNCPLGMIKPPSSTATTKSSSPSNSRDESMTSPRRHAVATSTPKSQRRSELQLVAKQPIPTPRQRFSSCLEYSTVTFVSSEKDPHSNKLKDAIGHDRASASSHNDSSQGRNQPLLSGENEKEIQRTTSQDSSVIAGPKPPSVLRERPVAKKRRSQLLMGSDSSYTTADIEDGLGEEAECDTSSTPLTSRSRGSRVGGVGSSSNSNSNNISKIISNSSKQTAAKRELFSPRPNHDQKSLEKDNSKSELSSSTKPFSSLLEVFEEEKTNSNCSRQKSIKADLDDCDFSQNSNNNNTNTDPDPKSVHGMAETETETAVNKTKDTHNKECSLPPLKRYQLARSPTASRRYFGGCPGSGPALSSSMECLGPHPHPARASSSSPSSNPLTRTYYSGLSSSLADLPSLMEPLSPQEPLLYSLHHDDDDDNDDENADDEMSVYNDEGGSPLPKTPSLEDLLRARSILDRSQAVARKRRQRMRNRKCRSQILSSTEVDDYYKYDVSSRRRPSRHSSKQKHQNAASSLSSSTTATAATSSTAATTTTANTTTTSRNTTAFAFDHPTVPYVPRRALPRQQNKLLNHTDSGMDSDGASPLNSRDFHHLQQHPGRQEDLQHHHNHSHKYNDNDNHNHQHQWTGRNTFEAPEGGSWLDCHGGSLSNRKSWEARFYERQGLKKYRSKEYLAYSDTSGHIDRRVYVSNGFETLV